MRGLMFLEDGDPRTIHESCVFKSIRKVGDRVKEEGQRVEIKNESENQ